jgi:hypothetical protein
VSHCHLDLYIYLPFAFSSRPAWRCRAARRYRALFAGRLRTSVNEVEETSLGLQSRQILMEGCLGTLVIRHCRLGLDLPDGIPVARSAD